MTRPGGVANADWARKCCRARNREQRMKKSKSVRVHRQARKYRKRHTHFPAAAPVGIPSPQLGTPKLRRKKGSRNQRLVLKFAAEEFRGEWQDVETRVIRHRVGRRFEKLGLPNPKYDVYLRALGRRKD